MLRGAIIQDGVSVACLPLIRFLQAVVTVTSAVAGALPTLALVAPPTTPLANQALIQHCINILHEDFPVLNAQAQAGQATQISVSINQLTQEYQHGRVLEEHRCLAEKQKKYSTLTDDATAARLCRLMDVVDKTQLPPLWNRFDKVYVLQTAMDTVKQTLRSSRLEFLARQALVDIVMHHGKFAMLSAYQPSTGLQPSTVPSGDAAKLSNIESTIISCEVENEKTKEWLASAGKKSEPNLLYRASRDGSGASHFHRMCDGKGATVTVMKSSDVYIFGGCTDVAWGQIDEDYHSFTESFMFSLKDHAGIGPVKMPIKSAMKGYAVIHDSSDGPIFGKGDLFVAPNVNSNTSSSCNVDSVYQLPSNTSDPHFLTGSQNFTVSEHKVFLV